MASHWYSWPMAGVCALTFGMFNSKKMCSQRKKKARSKQTKSKLFSQHCGVRVMERNSKSERLSAVLHFENRTFGKLEIVLPKIDVFDTGLKLKKKTKPNVSSDSRSAFSPLIPKT